MVDSLQLTGSALHEHVLHLLQCSRQQLIAAGLTDVEAGV
jgi:hypothetical protein